MFARVITLQLRPGKLDEFLRLVQDTIAPAAAAQPGFGGMTLLTGASHKVVAVGLWETEAGLLAGERAYNTENLADMHGLLAGPPLHEAYTVSLQVDLTPEGAAHIRGI